MAYNKTNHFKRKNSSSRLKLDGINFKNYSFTEETSYFDSNSKKFWDFGNDCWRLRVTCRVPKNIKDPENWIDKNFDKVKWLNY